VIFVFFYRQFRKIDVQNLPDGFPKGQFFNPPPGSREIIWKSNLICSGAIARPAGGRAGLSGRTGLAGPGRARLAKPGWLAQLGWLACGPPHEMPKLVIFTHSTHRKKAFFGQGAKKWILSRPPPAHYIRKSMILISPGPHPPSIHKEISDFYQSRHTLEPQNAKTLEKTNYNQLRSKNNREKQKKQKKTILGGLFQPAAPGPVGM